MWYFIFDLLLVILTALGVHRPVVLESIIRQKISAPQKFTLLVAYWVSVIALVLFAVIATNNITKDIKKIAFCSDTIICISWQNSNEDVAAALSVGELCRQALNTTRDSWKIGSKISPLLSEIARRDLSVAKCRIHFGMPRKKNPILISKMGAFNLCDKAMNAARRDWDISNIAAPYYREIKVRRYTVRDCRIALGLENGGDSNLPFENGESRSFGIIIQSDDKPTNKLLPTGIMNNKKFPYTNLRTIPGTKHGSRVIQKLYNGAKVTIMGSGKSPSSGHMYCKIMTQGDKIGYVDHQMLNGNCLLSIELRNIAKRLEKTKYGLFEQIADWWKN